MLVEHEAKVGLYDVELTLYYRHNFGKIIDDFRPATGNLERVLPVLARASTVSVWMLTALPNHAGC
jgi:hypothetical protein